MFGDGYLSTEHLLLGLTRVEDGVGVRVLKHLGVETSTIRAEVEKQYPRPEAGRNQEMSLTPRAKRVIDLAYEEARNLNNNYIGTEHLLLGLVSEGEGLAGRILNKLGIELEPARAKIVELQDVQGSPSTSNWSDAAASYYRLAQSTSIQSWTHYPQVFELLIALLHDSEDVVEKRLNELKTNRSEIKSDITRLLLNQ